MAMFTVYFDSSGQPYSTQTFSVAGFIAEADEWIAVQEKWQAVLSRFGVSSLHMKHYSHSLGEYASWRNDPPKRVAFLASLIEVIAGRVRHSFACSLDLMEYQRVDNELGARKIISPLALAGGRCIVNVQKWARHEKIPLDSILYVFEDGDVDKGNLMRMVKRDFGFTPLFQPKGNSSALQAADLIAYEHHLACKKIIGLEENELVELRDLRKSLQAIYWTPHFVGEEDSWVMFEKPNIEDGFRRVIAAQQGAAIHTV